jgi:hypothetical protein
MNHPSRVADSWLVLPGLGLRSGPGVERGCWLRGWVLAHCWALRDQPPVGGDRYLGKPSRIAVTGGWSGAGWVWILSSG